MSLVPWKTMVGGAACLLIHAPISLERGCAARVVDGAVGKPRMNAHGGEQVRIRLAQYCSHGASRRKACDMHALFVDPMLRDDMASQACKQCGLAAAALLVAVHVPTPPRLLTRA